MCIFRYVLGLLFIMPLMVAENAAAQSELTTVEGRYIRLITDRTDRGSLEKFVQSFDAAVPLWVQYWGRELPVVDDWRMTGYLMLTKADFKARRLIPDSLPDFLHGYQAGEQLWVVSQPSDYYTQHLLLHEGAHGIAEHLFGGAGAPWYMEGTAEYLATHQWKEDQLRIGVVPPSKDASPFWGRLGLIEERRRERKMPSLETVMRYGDTAHREVEPYAWSWGAALLMEMYPEYRQPFREAALQGRDTSPEFTRKFYQQLKGSWSVATMRWQLLCHDLEYGFDPERNRVDFPVVSQTPTSTKTTVRADQGWQCVPCQVRGGTMVRVTVQGMVQLEQDPRWKAGPDGVTIRYHRGEPLGKLLACIVSPPPADRYLPPLTVLPVGREESWTAHQDGWLLLKINESPSQLLDNQGEFEVQVEVAGP